MSCWPRNAQNKDCPVRYKLFPAQVVEANHDATYCLEFQFEATPSNYGHDLAMDPDEGKESQLQSELQRTCYFAPSEQHHYVENVREMWIKRWSKQRKQRPEEPKPTEDELQNESVDKIHYLALVEQVQHREEKTTFKHEFNPRL